MAQRDRSDVLASAAAGDEFAFRRIVAEYHDDMRRVCSYVTRDEAVAEEAAQAAWSVAWRKIGTVRDPSRLRPWLVSVAVNEAKQLLRKRRIAVMDLRVALDHLDPDDRALLAMRYVAGFDSNELATALGVSPSGVRSRIERIRARLRQELGDD